VQAYLFLFSCFFFQAEDGIRDFHVTGVQTCALPIFLWVNRIMPKKSEVSNFSLSITGLSKMLISTMLFHQLLKSYCLRELILPRSEERRVGKECRSWMLPYGEKKDRVKRWAQRYTRQ